VVDFEDGKAMRLFASLLLLLTCSLSAAGPNPAGVWAKTLDETSALLREKKFGEAQKRLESMKRDMLDRLGPGEAGARLFAIALGQLAVAQAGAGDTELAIWNWQAAQNLFPAVRDVDLSLYGEPGQLLKDNLLGAAPETCANFMKHEMVRKRFEPKYPKGAQAFGQEGLLIVQVRLDEKGRPRDPQVLNALAAPITYSVLDTLRRWEFTPPAPGQQNELCVPFKFSIGR
jgi:TonB family protein